MSRRLLLPLRRTLATQSAPGIRVTRLPVEPFDDQSNARSTEFDPWNAPIHVEIPRAARPPEPVEARMWTPVEQRTGLLALKKGMISMWDQWGRLVPATVLQMDETYIVANRTLHHDGRNALLLGCRRVDITSEELKRKYQFSLGVCRDAGLGFCLERFAEFPVSESGMIPVGTQLNAAHLLPGQLVDIRAVSKDKGFQGVMKRWGFKGQDRSHGVSRAHRSPGSIGCRKDPGKVWKGKKMPGHMGNENVTVLGLRVMKIDTAMNLIYVKGSVPGPKDSLVTIRDAIGRDRQQFDPYTHAPPFPTCTQQQIDEMPVESIWFEANAEDPIARVYMPPKK